MRRKQLLAIVATALAGALVLVAGAQGAGQSRDFEGAWRTLDTSNGKGALVFATHTGGDRYQVVVHEAEPRYPGVLRDTPLVGVARRVGHGLYEYTILKYRIALGDETIAATAVLSGDLEIGPDGILTWTSIWSVYTPDQDPWSGEPPAYGCFGPYTGQYTRVEMLPPCEL